MLSAVWRVRQKNIVVGNTFHGYIGIEVSVSVNDLHIHEVRECLLLYAIKDVGQLTGHVEEAKESQHIQIIMIVLVG